MLQPGCIVHAPVHSARFKLWPMAAMEHDNADHTGLHTGTLQMRSYKYDPRRMIAGQQSPPQAKPPAARQPCKLHACFCYNYPIHLYRQAVHSTGMACGIERTPYAQCGLPYSATHAWTRGASYARSTSDPPRGQGNNGVARPSRTPAQPHIY